eukprot:CAMPEP_0113571506 /NCGR_PEP_ID=MMETSP0015_2-20120614/25589_1 /TAXON_ID=2838 /ORGANISM="Odontella" /LENGTH=224 /DNA_ID=CAMNT_0000474459 /DNA_START=182 /DNA_END=859 /DNA_ORIENTATION=- /assembly_acc=CAM_ASM_000160
MYLLLKLLKFSLLLLSSLARQAHLLPSPSRPHFAFTSFFATSPNHRVLHPYPSAQLRPSSRTSSNRLRPYLSVLNTHHGPPPRPHLAAARGSTRPNPNSNPNRASSSHSAAPVPTPGTTVHPPTLIWPRREAQPGQDYASSSYSAAPAPGPAPALLAPAAAARRTGAGSATPSPGTERCDESGDEKVAEEERTEEEGSDDCRAHRCQTQRRSGGGWGGGGGRSA